MRRSSRSTGRSLSHALLAFTSGCWLSDSEVGAQLYGSDPGTASETDTIGSSDTGTTTDVDTGTATDPGTGTAPTSCVDRDLGSSGSVDTSGPVAGLVDAVQLSCASPSTTGAVPQGPDASLTWRAPRAGCWNFDTVDSTYDTVLGVLDGSGCSGAELACNDDRRADDGTPGRLADSMTGLWLNANDAVTVVVDSWDAAPSGSWALHIHEDPDALFASALPLGSATGLVVIAATNAGADTDLIDPTPCPWASSADVLYAWDAPSTGTWRFDVTSDFDAVVSVHARCNRQGLVCVDDAGGNATESAQAPLLAGERVYVRVAGYEDLSGVETGTFSLQIWPL